VFLSNDQLIEVRQFDGDQIVIGHDADVQLDLDHDSISPIHCLIERRDDSFFVCDLGSKAGTFKNGQAILDEILSSGDDVRDWTL
jgi:pSer/pThr/pTyr-binding forkhead associated (FHA) protein